jgi:diguanylate cyclase (GGDEF)-like protein
MMNIDHFKNVNDTLGHAAGDVVLQHLAGIMKDCIRETDLIARYGGEEFVALLPETVACGAEAIAERLRARIAGTPLEIGEGRIVFITISLGIACTGMDRDFPDLDRLLQEADEALFKAKNSGRNRIVV